jgi:hypothetical protein
MMTSSTTEAGAGPTGRPDPGHVLTWRLQTVLQAIRDFGQHDGCASTVREIGKAAGMPRHPCWSGWSKIEGRSLWGDIQPGNRT